MSLFLPAKRSGHKLYGRQIRLIFADGREEVHLLPPTALYRDLSLSQIEFDQWGPGLGADGVADAADIYETGDCMCAMWRARIGRHMRGFQLWRTGRLSLCAAKRLFWDNLWPCINVRVVGIRDFAAHVADKSRVIVRWGDKKRRRDAPDSTRLD